MTGQSYNDVLLQFTDTRDALKRYAPDKLVSGLTLEQIVARVAEGERCQKRVSNLEADLVGARNDRDRCFEGLKELCQFIKNAIAGDPDFGPDSTLYEALGYVRKSERKSGLTRRKFAGRDDEKT